MAHFSSPTATSPSLPHRVAGTLCWLWASLLVLNGVVWLFPLGPEWAALSRANLINLAVSAGLFALLYGIAAVGIRRGHLSASLLAVVLASGYSLLIVLAHWPPLLIGLPLNLTIIGLVALGWTRLLWRRQYVSA